MVAASFFTINEDNTMMGRFINLGIAIVNTDYIVRVESDSSGRAEIYLADGTMFRSDNFNISELYGAEHVVSIIPCEGVDAIYREGVSTVHIPLQALTVTASGAVIPVHLDGTDGKGTKRGEFLGLYKR